MYACMGWWKACLLQTVLFTDCLSEQRRLGKRKIRMESFVSWLYCFSRGPYISSGVWLSHQRSWTVRLKRGLGKGEGRERGGGWAQKTGGSKMDTYGGEGREEGLLWPRACEVFTIRYPLSPLIVKDIRLEIHTHQRAIWNFGHMHSTSRTHSRRELSSSSCQGPSFNQAVTFPVLFDRCTKFPVSSVYLFNSFLPVRPGYRRVVSGCESSIPTTSSVFLTIWLPALLLTMMVMMLLLLPLSASRKAT